MENKYEVVCANCSTVFLSDDEEALYCDYCWYNIIMKNFFETIRYDRF